MQQQNISVLKSNDNSLLLQCLNQRPVNHLEAFKELSLQNYLEYLATSGYLECLPVRFLHLIKCFIQVTVKGKKVKS